MADANIERLFKAVLLEKVPMMAGWVTLDEKVLLLADECFLQQRTWKLSNGEASGVQVRVVHKDLLLRDGE